MRVRKRLTQLLSSHSDVKEMCLECRIEQPVTIPVADWKEDEFCNGCNAKTKWVLLSGDALKRLYQQFDTDGSGSIDVGEFCEGMRTVLGFHTTSDEVLALVFRSCDADGNGELDYAEFVAGVQRAELDDIKARLRAYLSGQEGVPQLRKLFKKFDLDKSGGLDPDEFVEGLRHLGFQNSEEDIKEVFKHLDRDANGVLDFNEFGAGVLPECLVVLLCGYGAATTACWLLPDKALRWEERPSCWTNRGGAAMAVVRNTIFVFGGAFNPRGIECLDVRDGTRWKILDVRIPVPMYDHAATVIGDEVYLMGGASGTADDSAGAGGASHRVFRFNTQELQFEELEPMECARRECCAVAFDGEVYVIGGMDESGDILDTCEVFSPDLGEWVTLPELNEARRGSASVVFGGHLWVMGGGNALTDSATTEIWDPEQAEWTFGPPLTTARRNAGAGILQNEIYIAGGYSAQAAPLVTVEKYSSAVRTWVPSVDLPSGGPVLAGVIR
eukprot:NODE_224_length_2446_cov_10.308719_g17_i12.p1 GENE.NODE_224_length_2446_cov_10.308719_g17_i12~~NODE_224_length_2446_cov_10.308719_g17_i12.p1  ORF type:complete len:538 (-),score=74.12 NODE_224_length_2446_cov_10.308719_g17_i12:833-2329(-)